jgi:hypothetical protein
MGTSCRKENTDLEYKSDLEVWLGPESKGGNKKNSISNYKLSRNVMLTFASREELLICSTLAIGGIFSISRASFSIFSCNILSRLGKQSKEYVTDLL